MVDRKTALRMLGHTPSGPVLDMLYKSVAKDGYDFNYPYVGHPSTKVVVESLKKSSVALASKIAEATNDPEVLDYLASRDKRKGVRQAVVGNPHLSVETALKFARQLINNGEHPLFEELLKHSARDDGFFISKTLIEENRAEDGSLPYDIRRHIDSFVLACGRKGTNESFDYAKALMGDTPGRLSWYLVSSSCFRGSRVSTQRILDLFLTGRIRETNPSYNRRLGEDRALDELVRRCLKSSGSLREQFLKSGSSWLIQRALLKSAEPNPPVSTAEILRSLAGSWNLMLAAFLEENDVMITAEMADDLQRLLDARTFSNLFSSLRASWDSEAVRSVIASGKSVHPSAFSRVADPQLVFDAVSRIKNSSSFNPITSEMVALSHVRDEVLEKMLELDVPQERVFRFMTLKLDSKGGGSWAWSENARRLYLENSPTYPRTLQGHVPSVEELDIIIKRGLEDRELLRESGIFDELLRNSRSKIKREQLIKMIAVRPESFQAWRLSGPNHQPRAGDFTRMYALLDSERKEWLIRSHMEQGRMVKSAEPWLDEAISLVPGLVSAQSASAAVTRRLQIELGDDLILWETALTLIDDWTGTVEELVESCKFL